MLSHAPIASNALSSGSPNTMYSIDVSGGAVCGGSVAVMIGLALPVSGGAVSGGSSIGLSGRTITGSGGAICGGVASKGIFTIGNEMFGLAEPVHTLTVTPANKTFTRTEV